jgi:hypothetical protein
MINGCAAPTTQPHGRWRSACGADGGRHVAPMAAAWPTATLAPSTSEPISSSCSFLSSTTTMTGLLLLTFRACAAGLLPACIRDCETSPRCGRFLILWLYVGLHALRSGAVHRHLNGHRPGTASSAAAGTAGPPSGAHARMRVRACVRAWFLPQALRSVGVLPAVVICFRVLLTSHFLPLLPATLRIGLLAMRLLLLQRMNWKCRSSSRSASR